MPSLSPESTGRRLTDTEGQLTGLLMLAPSPTVLPRPNRASSPGVSAVLPLGGSRMTDTATLLKNTTSH